MKEILQMISRLERTVAAMEEETAFLRQQLESLRQEVEQELAVAAPRPVSVDNSSQPEPSPEPGSSPEPEPASPSEPASQPESEARLEIKPDGRTDAGDQPSTPVDKETPQSLADYYKQQRGQETLQQSLGSRQFADLQKGMSLNDRFRYQRDLFQGDSAMMSEVMSVLADLRSFEQAVDMLRADFSWDEEMPSVVDFYNMLQQYYS
ncbi:MAG: hypothetical protein IJ154_01335 [Bacteroidales bacterium]|nr:hypothetical protein [Bacteroidales bacterium]